VADVAPDLDPADFVDDGDAVVPLVTPAILLKGVAWWSGRTRGERIVAGGSLTALVLVAGWRLR
jgi:hypothetical protein